MASKSKEKVANLAPIPPFGASDAEIKEYEKAHTAWLDERVIAEDVTKRNVTPVKVAQRSNIKLDTISSLREKLQKTPTLPSGNGK